MDTFSQHVLSSPSQPLNMSQRSFSIGVLPIVRRKNRFSMRSGGTSRSSGSSSSSRPNLHQSINQSINQSFIHSFIHLLITHQAVKEHEQDSQAPDALMDALIKHTKFPKTLVKQVQNVRNESNKMAYSRMTKLYKGGNYGPADATTTYYLLLQKIQIGFTFLAPAHLGSPGQMAVKRVLLLLLLIVHYEDGRHRAPDGLVGILGSCVLTQHHLSLVLEVLHLTSVLKTASFCISRTSTITTYRLYRVAGAATSSLQISQYRYSFKWVKFPNPHLGRE